MLLGLVLAGGAWWANGITREQKRIEILLNKTREDYATRMELRDDMRQVMGTRSVPDYQGIDQSKLVPLLVKTIQELEARITALETAE